MKNKFRRIFLALTALAIIVSGCSDDSDNGAETTAANTVETTGEQTAPMTEIPGLQESYDNAKLIEALRGAMPKTDGSTSTLPLDIAVHAAVLGISRDEASSLVAHTKTYTSLENLVGGNCELIIRTPLAENEIQYMADAGFNYTAEPVSCDGFVFVVNAANPIDSLTQEQLRGIYSGEITNWSEVGGDDIPIIPYQRNRDSGSQNYMISFMGDTQLMAPVTDALPASMSGILDAVANYDNAEGAIGYSVYAYSDGMYEDMAKIKYVKVDGVEPSFDNMAGGKYPLIGYNYAIFSADSPEDSPARLLCKWMQSDIGQLTLADAGYVPYRSIEGIASPESAEKMYNSLGTGKGEVSDADYSYIIKNYGQNAVPVIADEKVNAIIADYYRIENARLEAITDAEIEAFLAPRKDNYPMSQRVIETSIVNGYLSVLSGVKYYYGFQDAPDYYYKAQGAVFDLYTGEQLILSDLFPEGSDFVPMLNAHLAKKAMTPYSGFGALHETVRDFTRLYEGKFTFTADSIIFTPGDIFYDGVKLSIESLRPMTVVSNPRDMAGILADADKCIYRTVTFHPLTDMATAIEYPTTSEGYTYFGLTMWLLDAEKSGLPEAVCNKVNDFALGLYKDYLSPEALLRTLGEHGVDTEIYTRFGIGPYPDFDTYVYGDRYIIFGGPNLLFAYGDEGTETVEFTLLENNSSNPYYFEYYFDAKTGEALKVDSLFNEGWLEGSSVSIPNELEAGNDTLVAALDFLTDDIMAELVIVEITDYDTAPNYSGTVTDNEIPAKISFTIGDGVVYTIHVPREFIK